MRKLFSLLIFLSFSNSFGEASQPSLKSGDIIFQTSNSKQSYAIMWASKSLYSHVGLIEVDGNKTYVIEAISKVSRTPIEKWIQRGRLERYSVYRYDGLEKESVHAIVQAAKNLLGRPYDIYFTSKNNEIYCSELVEIAYKEAGFAIGKTEKVKDLDVDNPLVRQLVKKRWKNHPLCKKKIKTFEECWNKILDDELISPESLSNDLRLKRVWTNYP